MPTASELVPQQALSIYLVRKDLDKGSIIPNHEKLKLQEFKVDDFSYELYPIETHPKTPEWVKFFPPEKIDASKIGKSTSPGAILLVKVDGRQYALTFGTGRYFLGPNCYELRFGLGIVINSVEKVRSVDKDSFDVISGKTRTQARKEFPVGEFGFDLEKDLLKTVSGVPKADLGLGERLTGIDNISAVVRLEFKDLPDYLRKLYHQSTLEEFKKNDFAFIDRIRPVDNPSLKDELDEKLLEHLRLRPVDNSEVELMLPIIVDFQEIEGFAYFPRRTKPEILADVSLKSFLDCVDSEKWDIDIESITEKRSLYYCSNGLFKRAASIYRCLFAEFEHNGGKYLLNDGSWYSINPDFVKRVDADIDEIRKVKYDFSFPLYGDLTKDVKFSENDYNVGIQTGDPSFICRDGKFLHPEKSQKFEFCDLFTSKYGTHDLIHVKKVHRATDSSHLFVQGLVSAECLLDFPEMRKSANKLIPELGITDHRVRIDPQKYRVVFVIIRKKGSKLPFLTRVSLREAFKTLRKWNCSPVLVEANFDENWLKKKITTKIPKP